MFAHDCTACHQFHLVFPDQITGLENTDAGIVVGFTCWCGSEQSIVTGRAADKPLEVVAA
ncbi:hypothetical protein [Nocardioides sp. YIM 152588]|uniref:hypothetical protein n=1 Tax=Nocardioides sp. YIM 152588 TaxID=3158259 RepID=UPI0032E3E9E0